MQRITPIMIAMMFLAVPHGSLWAQDQDEYELGKEGFEKVAEPEAGTPEWKLHQVRKLLAEEESGAAVKAAKRWIKDHPNHPLLPEAYLLRGDARVQGEDFYKALFDYEFVIRSYPDSEQFNEALRRELSIAEAFGRGVKRKFAGLRIMPAQAEAEEIYIRIQERAPGSKIAEQAGIELANFYYRRSDMFLAAEAYDLFLDHYPDSQWRELAMERHILANLATFKGPLFDATGLIEARERLAEYERDFPAAAERLGAESFRVRIDETLSDRAFLIARWYEKRGNPPAAAVMYRQVLKDYPGTQSANRALESLRGVDPSIPAPQADEATEAAPVEGGGGE